MIGYDEAAAITLALAKPLGCEEVSLARAAGRTLARRVEARIDSPRENVSAMDGYAVRESDLTSLPARLRVAGESFPSNVPPAALAPGECVRIFTGAPVPRGADRVVVQEVVRRDGDIAWFEQSLSPSRHIRARGSDFEAGEVLLEAGHRLDAKALVAAAGSDSPRVGVWRSPQFTLLSTGDELVEPGEASDRPGSIPDSLSYGIVALAESWGGECVGKVRLRDEPLALEKAAADALARSDIVIVTGGASVGERDYAKSMFEPAGLELLFAKVAIKPGKPVWLARASGTIILGLPGNPTSAMVTARLFLAPLIAGLSGRDPGSATSWRSAALACGLEACGDRETFYRARWSGGSVEPIANQESGAQKALASAQLLLRRRAGAPASAAGDQVQILDF